MATTRKRPPGKPQTDHNRPSEPASRKLQAPLANHTTDPSNAPIEATALVPQKRGTGGAPLGNRNHLRHGLRSGSLPKDSKYVENQCNALRRALEDACLDVKGAVSLTDAAHIATAVKYERHGALCLRWMRLKGKDLTPEQFIKFSESIARASENRDKAIRQLDLEVKRQTDWHTILIGPDEQPEAEQ